MYEFMEAIFPMIFLGYLIYIWTIQYCLIPILFQIVFSYFIEDKQLWKVAIMVFLTQGIVVPIAEMNYDMIYSIVHYSENLGFWNVVISKNFRFDIIYSLLMFVIIIGISFFTYISIEKNMNYKKWIAFLCGYLVNIAIMVFMMLEFGVMVNLF